MRYHLSRHLVSFQTAGNMTRIIETHSVSYHFPDAGTHESLASSFLGVTLAAAAGEGSLSKIPLALVLAGVVAVTSWSLQEGSNRVPSGFDFVRRDTVMELNVWLTIGSET